VHHLLSAAELEGATEDEKFRRAAMAGVPGPLVDLRVVGDGGVQPGTAGASARSRVRGPFINRELYRVPPDPGKFTEDGWLRTGDVASVDELGLRAASPDRTKDLIKCRRRVDQVRSTWKTR